MNESFCEELKKELVKQAVNINDKIRVVLPQIM